MILISIEAVCVMAGDVGEVTMLLKAMNRGEETAADKLLALVYDELHRSQRGTCGVSVRTTRCNRLR